jgi:hypothetical protein
MKRSPSLRAEIGGDRNEFRPEGKQTLLCVVPATINEALKKARSLQSTDN